MKKTWGGRFKRSTDPLVEDFTESLSVDKRLAPFDVEGSQAHVRTLAKAGLLSQKDAKKLAGGLRKVKRLLDAGKISFNSGMEDIHTAVEKNLTGLVGSVGGKLHTGRSRNDQVATDFRLYLRQAVKENIQAGTELVQVLLRLAFKEKDTLMPGYTHLQRAMPVTLGHHLACYAFMLLRDMDRFLSAWDRADALPLGSGALAGTNHRFDRNLAARVLGFKTVIPNSLDAVSDRDAYVDFLSAAALTQMHLSRISEDLILWATSEFGFIEMDDAYSTGSSLMPQKKNPDVPELIRGKSGRVFADLMGLLIVLKGLPLTYNRDLQEDKHFVFDAADTVKASLRVMSGFFNTLKFQRERMEQAADQDLTLLATDLADILVVRGIPFREAHQIVGNVVRYSLGKEKRIQDLTDQELKRFSKLFPKGTAANLSAHKSVRQKKAVGGTSPKNVSRQIQILKRNLSRVRKRLSGL